FWIGIAAWPAVYQYLMYNPNDEQGTSWLGNFEREPKEEQLNKLQSDGDKTWDLAWVYTVVAGVLNILVVYDAFAGPTFSGSKTSAASPGPTKATAAA